MILAITTNLFMNKIKTDLIISILLSHFIIIKIYKNESDNIFTLKITYKFPHFAYLSMTQRSGPINITHSERNI